jgi:hypothetical protein
MLNICTNSCIINKTVHFVTYCIYVVLDYPINIENFSRRIISIGRILREAGINFILIGQCSPKIVKVSFQNFRSSLGLNLEGMRITKRNSSQDDAARPTSETELAL